MYRILHIIDHLGPGGAQEALLNLVKFADRSRFEPEVAAMHGFGVYYDSLQRDGVRVHSLSPHKLVPLYLPNLAVLLGRGRFDLVHCHLIAANLIAKPLAKIAGVPVLFNHDQCNDVFRYRNKVRMWLDSLTNGFTDQIIAVSQSTRDFLLEQEKIPPQKVAVIYNAVDVERFSPAPKRQRQKCRHQFGIPDQARVVLGAGRLMAQKNFPGFLEAAAALSRLLPEVQFVIAGEGPDRAALENLAGKLGLADRVRFLGFVTNMPELYLASDVLFFPSFFEGTPMTVLEAMASGLPIVASEIDGTAEVLTDGVEALLARPEQTRNFVEKVAALLQDQALARRLAKRALAKVREQYSATAMVREVEQLYLQHLRQKGR